MHFVSKCCTLECYGKLPWWGNLSIRDMKSFLSIFAFDPNPKLLVYKNSCSILKRVETNQQPIQRKMRVGLGGGPTGVSCLTLSYLGWHRNCWKYKRQGLLFFVKHNVVSQLVQFRSGFSSKPWVSRSFLPFSLYISSLLDVEHNFTSSIISWSRFTLHPKNVCGRSVVKSIIRRDCILLTLAVQPWFISFHQLVLQPFTPWEVTKTSSVGAIQGVSVIKSQWSTHWNKYRVGPATNMTLTDSVDVIVQTTS